MYVSNGNVGRLFFLLSKIRTIYEMLPIAAPPFPKTLQYMATRLANVSRRKVRLTELSSTSAKPNGLITVTLPQEVIDLDTFQLYGKITTTTSAGAAAPQNADLLIQDYTVASGGQVLNSVFNNPQLHFLVSEYTLGDKANARSLTSTLFNYSSSDVPQAPASNLTNQPFCIASWLGFLNSIQPRVLDFSLLPKTQVTFRLASTDVLVLGTSGAGADYSISDIAFEVDVMQFDDTTRPSKRTLTVAVSLSAPLATGTPILQVRPTCKERRNNSPLRLNRSTPSLLPSIPAHMPTTPLWIPTSTTLSASIAATANSKMCASLSTTCRSRRTAPRTKFVALSRSFMS